MKQNITDFIGSIVTTKEITRHGKVMEFHFREMSALEAETLGIALRKLGDDVRGSRAKVITKVVCTEDGEPLFNEHEANGLPSSLASDLQGVAFEVNGLGAAAEAQEAKN